MKKNSILLLLLFLVVLPEVTAQDAKFKALFMYNFTKYLEWPPHKQSGDFVIGILGTSPISNELKIIAQKKKVGNQPIRVIKINGLEEANSCNIIFIPENKTVDPKNVKTHCTKKGTVLITEKPGLAKSYAGINYIKVNGKQNFEVNRRHIEDQGIKVNSQLLSLGILVN